MIIYLAIVCHKAYWPVVEKKVNSFEQALGTSRVSEPISDIYWKDGEFFEFCEGVQSECDLDEIDSQISRLCSGFGMLATGGTSGQAEYSVNASLEEMHSNRKRVFVNVCVPTCAAM